MKKNIFQSPENFFLWGLIFFFLVPPFQAPDKQIHFLRIFQLSCGTLISPGGEKTGGDTFPNAILDFIQTTIDIRFNKEKNLTILRYIRS